MNSKYQANDKLSRILESISSGNSREEVAQQLGYKNWKCLDMYVRRRGLKWDPKKQNYYDPSEQSAKKPVQNESSSYKVSSIISMFNKENADPMEIAKKSGFNNHHELASYMAARGFTWSHEKNNYIRNPKTSDIKPDTDCTEFFAGEVKSRDISEYIPILDAIAKNKDKLKNLINSPVDSIPRYIIPGINRTKSFYMSDKLSRILCEFSRKNNISQKEIIEAALIEFLRRHHFEDEVNNMLEGF